LHEIDNRVEQRLAKRLRNGENGAMQEFYTLYAEQLAGVCARYIVDKEDIKDVFQEDGSFSGRIKDLNDFSGSYTLPFVGKRAYYQDIEHGVINMSDWKVTDVNDNDPVSKQFMRMSKATQFKPVWPYYLILYVSSKEYFMFRTAQ